MDLVYVIKEDGGSLDSIELKYSLRSLKNVVFDAVWIVGYKPDWCINVNHLYINDLYKNKIANVIYKLIQICKNRDISEEFILMNDDFFFLKPQTIETFTLGLLEDLHPKKRGGYKNALISSIHNCQWLNSSTKNYELHYPMIINKKQFLQLFNNIKWLVDPPCFRSVYGNYYDVESVELEEDFKAYDVLDWKKLLNKDFISTDNNMISCPIVQRDFQILFPDKGDFER